MQIETTTKKIQKRLTDLLEADALATIMHRSDAGSQARIRSASGPWANGWLNVASNPEEPTKWLANDELRVVILNRLGCPISERPAPCVLCNGNNSSDIFGRHAQSCRCSLHNEAHHRLVSKIAHYAAGALAQPLQECCPFVANGALRVDVLFRANVGDQPVASDVAIISPFVLGNLPAAISSPGGAATAYESVKNTKYSAAARAAGITFVPLVVDSLGSWGQGALPLLQKIARGYGRRFDIPHSLATRIVQTGLSLRLQASVAAILLAHSRSQGARSE
jgi:hypothetical protein